MTAVSGLCALGMTKVLSLVNHGCKYNLDYLHTVQRVKDKNIEFVKENDGFYCIKNTTGKTLKILQLSDLHIGGGFLSRHEDRLVFKTINEIVTKVMPDLIVITGDLVCSKPSISFSRNNMNSMVQIVMLLERMGIPYAITFGNKDSVWYATHSREQLRNYLMKQNNCLVGWDGEKIMGDSNYLIKVRDNKGDITNIMYFLDTNSYSGYRHKSYGTIHNDQIEWYEKKVNAYRLADKSVIPSCIFMHMPLPEFREAWKMCENGEYNVTYVYGKVNEKISCPKKNSGLFDKIVRLKSSNAVFCGHDHLNNYSIIYDGVRLTCGKSLDYIMYGKNISGHRGGTIIYLSENGEVRTKG